ncbi:GNAT family acetyltransferase [Pseudomonas sp. nanlin1]|uniref:GNAT family acetyltransferase n=1 Tax=Pseudomonas sp. nanlin1 TaxID=3040605 RepID=UPI00389040E0
MTVITEFANDAHRLAVVELWKNLLSYPTPHNEPGLAIEQKLAAADGLFFVALHEGALAGTIMAGYDGHRGWLYSLAVQPGLQRKGIGAALVAHAEQALTTRGCLKVNLQIVTSNQAVQGFYERLGYVVEPRISMGKLLY